MKCRIWQKNVFVSKYVYKYFLKLYLFKAEWNDLTVNIKQSKLNNQKTIFTQVNPSS